MGMLDDAIREHLELKRRQGGDEDEVARLEAEVLKQPEPAPEPAEPVAEPAEPVAQDAPAVHDVVPPFTAEEPWLDEPDEVPAGESLEHPRGKTTEFTPEEVAEAEGEPEFVAPDEEPGEDVLEETPDFLQETPEHDRLWFEQKPPRDFDFDG